MSGDLVDDEDGHEGDGIAAFNRMSAALDNLQTHLAAFDQGLNLNVKATEKAASKAATAASDAKAVVDAAKAVAQAQGRSLALWAGCSLVAGMVVAAGSGYRFGYSSGWEGGQADGYRTAMDEKAAAAWANTPNGKRAFELDRLGSLNRLAACSEAGLRAEKRRDSRDGRVCFVSNNPDGQNFGWYIP